MKAIVLGPSGMLGHEMVKTLRTFGIEVKTAGRIDSDVYFDAQSGDFTDLKISGFDYVVNCIGLTTHNIDEGNSESVATAEEINTDFPISLARAVENGGVRLIQIATDCVFSGSRGGYLETDSHDAIDVYGRTKSNGEVLSPSVMHIRSSIIGREQRGKKSLLEWTLGQPNDAQVPGFTDRMWNGVTTLAFSRVVAGVILKDGFVSGVSHLCPADKVSKFELVSLIASRFGRHEINVNPERSGVGKDLTLSTVHPKRNLEFWLSAGYQRIPTIQELIAEISD